MKARDPVLAGLACAMALGCFVSQTLLNVAFIVSLFVLCYRIEVEKTRTLCRLPGLDIAVLLYVAAFVVSAGSGIDPDTSFRYITELKRPLIAYILVSSLSSRRDVLAVVSGVAIGAAVSSVVAYSQWIFGGTITLHRVVHVHQPWEYLLPIGLSSSNNDLATMLVMAFGLVIVPVAFFPGSLPRGLAWGSGICAAIVYAGLLRTLARAGLLASVVSFILVGLMLRPRRAIACFLLVAALYPFLPESLRQRHHDLFSLRNYSNWYRVRMIEVSGEMARHHAVLGIGRRNFGEMHRRIAQAGEEIAPHAHNNYLMLLVEHGAAGLVAFVWLQFSALFYCANRMLRGGLPELERSVMGGCLMALLAFGITGLFHFTWGDTMPASFHWVVIGLAYAVGERHTLSPEVSEPKVSCAPTGSDEPSSAASTVPA